VNILEAIDSPDLFAPWFKDPATWKAWRAFLTALFGLPMDEEMLALYRHHTGRQEPPTAPFEEAWLVIGRRGGKSFVKALLGVYLATFRDYRQYLQPGERATVPVMAADRRQARTILRYVRGLVTGVPELADMVERETADGFDFNNAVTIEITVNSYRSSRGYTYPAVLADEIAFWTTDGDAANPDVEVLDAVRPGMATIPGSVLICGSSPYAQKGALFDAYRTYWGKDDPNILVWKGTTREMNPAVRQSVIDRAMERDPESAAAEYMAEFRKDIADFVTREAVDACIARGVFERPHETGKAYVAFVDPSGGSADSMTLAIGHRDGRRGVLDAMREVRPPFSPEATVMEFATLLKAYGLSRVKGDRYAGEWPREVFRKQGITYDLSEQSKSEIYVSLLPLINSNRAELLDDKRLVAQLVGLERRTSRAGRDSVDHVPGGHDDVINAVAGALVAAAAGAQPMVISDAVLRRAAQPTLRAFVGSGNQI